MHKEQQTLQPALAGINVLGEVRFDGKNVRQNEQKKEEPVLTGPS